MAKLNTLGHAAYISPRGRASPDVIVVVAGQRKSNRGEDAAIVDRIAEITRWPVDMETKGDADFFIFIELDLRSLSPAFLLTNAQARETHKNYMGSGNRVPAHVLGGAPGARPAVLKFSACDQLGAPRRNLGQE